jgi:hypothetical protein
MSKRQTTQGNPKPDDLPEEAEFLRHNPPDERGYCSRPVRTPPRSPRQRWRFVDLYTIYRLLTRGR